MPAAQAMATAAASAYMLDNRESANAHGLVDEERRHLGPARTATLATTEAEKDLGKNGATPPPPSEEQKKELAANASTIAGVPRKVDNDGLADNTYANKPVTGATGGGGGASQSGGFYGGQAQQAAAQQAAVDDKTRSACSDDAIARLEQTRGQGGPDGSKATLDLARCYRQNGRTDLARARYSTLIPTPAYGQIAQQELDQMAPVAAAHRAAPQVAPKQQATTPAATTTATSRAADSY
jgi:hypothetical protein